MVYGWIERGAGVDPEWDDFVARSIGGHHTQTSRWGLVQSRRGWDVARLGLRAGDDLVAGVQILTKRVRGAGSVAYVDRGPLGAETDELRAEVLEGLRRFAADRAVRLLMVQPPDHATDTEHFLRNYGFGDTHLKTSLAATTVLGLGPEPDALLQGMKSKTRYNIRKGLRAGVTVREGTVEDVRVFHAMLERTAQRQGFVANSRSHLEDIVATLGDWARIFLAEVDGQAVAGMLAMTFADTVVYKRGAWSGERGDARPNEVMHWGVIQWAREHGFSRYDFDGIEPDLARRALAGEKISGEAADSVTRFKLGFGADVVLLPETLSYVPSTVLRFGYDRLYPRVAAAKPVKRLVKRVRVG